MMKVTAFYGEQYDNKGWPPESAEEFMRWFASKLAEIPDKYRHTATIQLRSSSGYEGDHYASIHIEYERPRTQQEEAEREAKQRLIREDVEADERRVLAKLQAKYGAI